MKKIYLVIPCLAGFAAALIGWQLSKPANYGYLGEPEALKKAVTHQQNTKKVSKNKKEVMMGHPDLFAQMQRELRTHSGDHSPAYPDNYLYVETEKARQALRTQRPAKSSALRNMETTERGPSNVGGRTRAIVVDSTDITMNTWFVGAVGGGIWKTTNAGKTWENKTPNIPNLAISSMAMAASNRNIIYAGTGEGFYNLDAIRGDGLIKSTDYGETWSQVSNTVTLAAVNRIIVSPEDANIVIAAVSSNRTELDTINYPEKYFSRICKSTDGGDSWKVVLEEPKGNRIQDLVFHPSNFSVQYASINAVGIFKSLDSGETWEKVLGLSEHLRSELAIAPGNPKVVYAAVQSKNSFGLDVSMLFKSSDSGLTWDDLSNGGNLPNWMGAQGWYDNTIGINPYNENDVFLGGIQLWRTGYQKGGISSVELINTGSFLSFFPWGGYNGMGIGTGKEFCALAQLPEPIQLQESDYTNVEIRFGQGVGQKAHTFVRTNNGISFTGYNNVDFQVWDIVNNKQLMVSFIDVNGNGTFDLLPESQDITELIFIHAQAYSASNSSTEVTGNNGLGFIYKNIFTIWPVIAPGANWDPASLPDAKIKINYSKDGEEFLVLNQITDGYNDKTQTGTHVDHHNLTMVKLNTQDSTFRIINGNDGGVFYSDNEGTNWSHTLNGYITTQFYGVDKKHGSDEYIGGMQDNGTWKSPAGISSTATSKWVKCIGGDGYEAAWHYDNPTLLLGSSQFNGLARSTDNGKTWNSIAYLVDNGAGNAPFCSKIAKSNSDPDLVFVVGINGVWRSDNFGETWTLAQMDKSKWSMNSLTQVEISQADPRIVWAGSSFNDPTNPQSTLHLSKDGGISFLPVQSSSRLSLGRISGFATHPKDPATAYMTFAFANYAKILRTTDWGKSWEDISGFNNRSESDNGFPNVAVFSLLVMPHDPNILWAGTEIGLFESIDKGKSWHYAIDEFPAVSIWKMKIIDNQVVIATHGRGIITVTIDELSAPPVVTKAPRVTLTSVALFKKQLTISADLRSSYDSTLVYSMGKLKLKLAANATPEMHPVVLPIYDEGDLAVQLKSYKNGEEYISSIINYNYSPLMEVKSVYLNSLHEENNHFIFNEFAIMDYNGFDYKALHSPHPCQNNQNHIAMLRVPIVVRDKKANIIFNEVVIAEPGDPGSVYGTESFYDYVVIEGSKDGVNWKPFEPGYDSRLYEEWVSAFNTNMPGNSSLYRKHSIDMLKKFKTNDTVLIRFRIYTDMGVTSWGWVIDSLEIQNEKVGVNDNLWSKNEGLTFSVYPNPLRGEAIVNISCDKPMESQLDLFDLEGRLIKQITKGNFSAGNSQVTFASDDISSGTYVMRISSNSVTKTQKLFIYK